MTVSFSLLLAAFPACVTAAVKCTDPIWVQNGEIDCSSRDTVGDPECTVTCDDNYTLKADYIPRKCVEFGGNGTIWGGKAECVSLPVCNVNQVPTVTGGTLDCSKVLYVGQGDCTLTCNATFRINPTAAAVKCAAASEAQLGNWTSSPVDGCEKEVACTTPGGICRRGKNLAGKCSSGKICAVDADICKDEAAEAACGADSGELKGMCTADNTCKLGPAPECKAESIPTVANGELKCDSVMAAGSPACTLVCSEKFRVNPATLSATSCDDLGQWTGELGACEQVIDCAAPTVFCRLANDYVGRCSDDKTCEDVDVCQGKSTDAECGAHSGELNGKCTEENKCEVLPSPCTFESIPVVQNGKLDCRGKMKRGSGACDLDCGEFSQGSVSATKCDATGKWTGEIGSCKDADADNDSAALSAVAAIVVAAFTLQ